MSEWKRILCAVDFGAPSRAAVEQAAGLARRFDGELTLVHVVGVPAPAASDVLVSSREAARIEARREEEELSRWRQDAEARSGRSIASRVLSGDAAAEITRLARDERFDLVVVGTHGRTGVPRLFLGSVAERIVRGAPGPVLVVREPDEG